MLNGQMRKEGTEVEGGMDKIIIDLEPKMKTEESKMKKPKMTRDMKQGLRHWMMQGIDLKAYCLSLTHFLND